MSGVTRFDPRIVIADIPAVLKQFYAGNDVQGGKLVSSIITLRWPQTAINHFDELQEFFLTSMTRASELPSTEEPFHGGNHEEEGLAYMFQAVCILLGRIHKEASLAADLGARGTKFMARTSTVFPQVFESWWKRIQQENHAFFPNSPRTREAIFSGLGDCIDMLSDETRRRLVANTRLPDIILRAWAGTDTVVKAATWQRWLSKIVDCETEMPRKYHEQLVKDLGVTRVVNQLTALLINEREKPTIGFALWPAIINILKSSYSSALNKALIDSEFTEIFFAQLWALAKDFSHQGLATTRKMLNMLSIILLDMTPQAHLKLLSKYDLVPLAGRMLFLFGYEDDSNVRDISESTRLVKLLTNIAKASSKYLRGHWMVALEPVFLPTLAALRSVATNTIQRTIAIWMEFGRVVGLDVTEQPSISSADVDRARVVDEKDFRRKFFAGKPIKPLAGCSWERCVFFGADSRRVMLRCFGCGQAQYCAIHPCQSRAWIDGGHKQSCKRRKGP